MHQISGLILIQQREKSLKAPMGHIVLIPEAPHRGMGQHNVHPAGQGQLQPQPVNAPAHLLFRILMGPAVIQGAAAQTQNAQPAHSDQLPVNALAALRRPLGIAAVVIAGDIEQGPVGHGHQEAEILRLQVSGGEDQVDALQPPRLVKIPQVLIFFVGNQ